MSKIDPKKLEYEGCDLEAMAQAPNYYNWIISIIKPYIGKVVVEVGAGSGSFSKHLLTLPVRHALLIEPTKNMYKHLVRLAQEGTSRKPTITTYNSYLSGIRAQVSRAKPDTFVYINVFEHIEDDQRELNLVYELLPKGGHAIIFVPAHQLLFGEFDRRVGHFRRYSKSRLLQLVRSAGMEVTMVRRMDMPGTIPWLLNFVLLRRSTLNPGLVSIYDRFLVPIIRTVESFAPIPFGKNLLIIARKR